VKAVAVVVMDTAEKEGEEEENGCVAVGVAVGAVVGESAAGKGRLETVAVVETQAAATEAAGRAAAKVVAKEMGVRTTEVKEAAARTAAGRVA